MAPKKRGKNKKRSTKDRHPWEKLEAEFIISDPEVYVTLESFFAPKGISKNTYANYTREWHQKRKAYRRQIGLDILENYRQKAVKTALRVDQQAGIITALAFSKLVVTDPESKEVVLVPGLKNGEIIRLLSEGIRTQYRTVAMADNLTRGLEPKTDPNAFVPPTPAATVPEIDANNAKEVERRRRQAILRSDEASDAVETILKAIDRGESK